MANVYRRQVSSIRFCGDMLLCCGGRKGPAALISTSRCSVLQDVSCNEITHLPAQLGDLDSLRDLDVRRNLLVELPPGE